MSQALPPIDQSQRWYQGISRYQWLVLVIASLGWVFDIFEGQIFVAAEREVSASLLPASAAEGDKELFKNASFAVFLLGGALGGVFFGYLSDRIGRTRTMIITILVYSMFTFVSALAMQPWHMLVCRFLVAMGVGGEWAVASALVAEVFPKRARAWSLAIFHASSVLGTLLAALAGAFLVVNPALGGPGVRWRWAFVVGVLPALLVLWIRMSLKEPEEWKHAKAQAAEGTGPQMGRLVELFQGTLLRHTFVGLTLAAVGLATFWGVHVNGKNLLMRTAEAEVLQGIAKLPDDQRQSVLANLRQKLAPSTPDSEVTGTANQQPRGNQPDAEHAAQLFDRVAAELPQRSFANIAAQLTSEASPMQRKQVSQDLQQVKNVLLDVDRQSIKRWEMLGMILVTIGGGVGLVAFGPISERLGRRGAFLFYHLGGLGISLLLFLGLAGESATVIGTALPVFGFLTLGMHAGYAVYFPELFPTRLRGTGGGFCFNGGRVVAAPILFLAGWMQSDWGFSLNGASALLSLLFLLGVLVLLIAPETRGQDLPE